MSSGRKRNNISPGSSIKLKRKLPILTGRGDRTEKLNAVLIDLSKKTEDQLEYWDAFENYLVGQREFRKERIHETLRSKMISGYDDGHLVRVVDTRYQNRPLSSFGSIVVAPGGRFNFGEISASRERFQALYLASDFRTAVSERFLKDQGSQGSVKQDSLILRLDPEASFSSYRIRASNLNVIDIRKDESLEPFLEVVAEIVAPRWLVDLAKKLKQPPPQTIQSVKILRALLLDPNFTQWGSLIDQPSTSQWFGYYVREAGIHGIVYPSVRSREGYNLCVFPDTFSGSSAKIELLDSAAGVLLEDRTLDETNATFHMQISKQDSGQDLVH